MKVFTIGLLCVAAILHGSCAHRSVLVDEAGQPISTSEVQKHRKHSHTLLYAAGGGALSLGASFFVGSLVDRRVDDSNHSMLWIVTGMGTAVGTFLFLRQGRTRDFNAAVEQVKEERRSQANAQISEEEKRQSAVSEDIRRLQEERRKQDEERQRLLEEIRKKQKPANTP